MLDLESASLIVSDIFSEDSIPRLDRGVFSENISSMTESIKQGDLPAFERIITEIVENYLRNEDFQSLSIFSRVVIKSLALRRVVYLPAEAQNKLIETAYFLHVRACKILNEWAPPAQIPHEAERVIDSVALNVSRGDDGVIVFTMVTRSYLDNLRIWINCYRVAAQCNFKILILCLDDCAEQVSRVVGDLDIDVEVVNLKLDNFLKTGNGKSLSFIWYYKILFASKLVESGVSVIYSDLDSFWLGDVAQVVDLVQFDSDLIFMESDSMPPISRLKIGLTLGCGFFMVRPTTAAIKFLDFWVSSTAIMLDDQIALFQCLLDIDAAFENLNNKFIKCRSVVSLSGIPVRVGVFSKDVAWRVGTMDSFERLNWVPRVIHPRWVLQNDISPEKYLERLLSFRGE